MKRRSFIKTVTASVFSFGLGKPKKDDAGVANVHPNPPSNLSTTEKLEKYYLSRRKYGIVRFTYPDWRTKVIAKLPPRMRITNLDFAETKLRVLWTEGSSPNRASKYLRKLLS